MKLQLKTMQSCNIFKKKNKISQLAPYMGLSGTRPGANWDVALKVRRSFIDGVDVNGEMGL